MHTFQARFDTERAVGAHAVGALHTALDVSEITAGWLNHSKATVARLQTRLTSVPGTAQGDESTEIPWEYCLPYPPQLGGSMAVSTSPTTPISNGTPVKPWRSTWQHGRIRRDARGWTIAPPNDRLYIASAYIRITTTREPSGCVRHAAQTPNGTTKTLLAYMASEL